MRIGNLGGRAHLVRGDLAIDIAKASAGTFGPEPGSLFARWPEFLEWAGTAPADAAVPYRAEDLSAPIPRPRQVFAVGLNYAEHAAETGLRAGGVPSVFTKFADSLTGPHGRIRLSGPSVDWEVELVFVIGREARDVAEADAWTYVAGLMVGQDFSDRDVQMSGTPPQFSLGKSYPGFGPTGPVLVTPDEIDLSAPLRLRCWVNDELVQDGHTGQMILPVGALIERISAVCTLHPGDLLFTGTPAGVGMGRTPPRYLAAGDIVRTSIEGIGEMRHVFVPKDAG
ncbi:fumarylacetoacetate hydrolase [Amycolatopsis sp. AA4]|uniref:fumarylacetoacetate hydrolase family protein n=1 Tax=Actinomycetes TaxID=1760 RepID=UPI0001B56B26|nr:MULTISPECIES: fumarylacetoacetate hydrolase family protein [Actinomycetes]ATY12750.1 fumarylacetoacetate hydrolase [Amycolatopsis sp. AA4]EFL08569.1 4-hydroxyphenylacetate degradation bifunctional isomerase/decarboxylase [Streptomyces sp. AA4]